MTKRDYSRADIYTIYNKFREPLQNDKKKGLQPEEATKMIKFLKTLSVVTHSLSLRSHELLDERHGVDELLTVTASLEWLLPGEQSLDLALHLFPVVRARPLAIGSRRSKLGKTTNSVTQ